MNMMATTGGAARLLATRNLENSATPYVEARVVAYGRRRGMKGQQAVRGIMDGNRRLRTAKYVLQRRRNGNSSVMQQPHLWCYRYVRCVKYACNAVSLPVERYPVGQVEW